MSTLDSAMNHLADMTNAIGTVVSKTLGSNVSLAAGSAKALVSVNLTPGTWVLAGCVRADGTAGGYRVVNISTLSASISTGAVCDSAYEQIWTTGSGYWCCSVSRIVQITTNTTYYLNVQQSCTGTAASGQCHLRAVRIV